MPELIDWTFSDAPDPDAPPPAPISPVPSRRPARRTWGLLGGLVILALLGPLAFHVWTEYRVQRDIRRVIAVEESAGRAGDIDALWNLADPNDWTWRKALLQLAVNNQPAPLPSPALRPVPSSADAIAFTILAPDEVRADVTRSFLAPDGARLSFTLPQYYRVAQAAWVRVAPPQAVDTPAIWSGVYAVVAHPTADADYVDHDLGPYLDDVLRRACQAWACPPGLTAFVTMEDGFSFDSWPGRSQQPVQAPLLFAFVRNTDPVARAPSQGYLTGVPVIQSPRLAGYPADAASAAWLRRAIAEQALNELATRLVIPAGAERANNAILLALVAREAARLGLEPPAVLDTSSVTGTAAISGTLSLNVNLMWDLGLPDARGEPLLGYRWNDGTQIGPDDPHAWDEVLGGALAVTNWLMRDQPPETDGQMLRGLASARDQVAWLAHGLGISPDDSWARLQLAAWHVNQPAGQPELALNCSAGIGLSSPGRPQPVFFLPVEPSEGWGTTPSYSPDGRWLVTNAGPIVDMETGRLVRLPAISPGDSISFRGWISNTVLAYVLEPAGGSSAYGSIHFFDVADPQRALPALDGIDDYSLSPDKTHAAAIVTKDLRPSGDFALEVIPAQGGPPTPIFGVQFTDLSLTVAAWAPDSRSLAVANADQTGHLFALRVVDATSGVTHDALSSSELGATGSLLDHVAWSPSGRQIAFALLGGSGAPSPLGLVNADGTGLRLLENSDGFYAGIGFSADGSYLAATFYGSAGDAVQAGTTRVYDVASGREVNELINSWSFAWSPHGHALAVLHNPVYLLDDPTDSADSARQVLAYDNCSSLVWNPVR